MTKSSTDILRKLRSVMKDTRYVTESLNAYIIPSGDAHQSEYIAPCHARREFISGFTGSRGTAVVTEKHAALWTDGRYYLQAQKEMDNNWTLMKERVEGTPSIGEWLNQVIPDGSKVGVDPFLLEFLTWKSIYQTLQIKNNLLLPTEKNLVDVIWENQPSLSSNPVEAHDLKYTGKSFEQKISDVRKEMAKKKVSALVLTALDEIAWLFNLRGSDIIYNPVFFSYAIVTKDNVYLFIHDEKLTKKAKDSLLSAENVNLEILPYENVLETLKMIFDSGNNHVWMKEQSSYKIVSSVPKKNRLLKNTPVELLKCIKNETEIEGSKNAHIKDGAAICEFFCWLSQEILKQDVTELTAASKLESLKREQEDFVGLSFETISASGPNSAIIHYTPTKQSDRKLSTSEIYLCDNGTQYRDGTTDVTRTWHFGEPTAMEKKCYTLVLKGHIALTTAVFPSLCKGHRIDCLSRKFLWEAGLDYNHGTGHGTGSYLNVHEGPALISFIYKADDPGFQPGMISSIEPGYYEDGNFGIRIENLAFTKVADTQHNFEAKQFLTFEPLTLVPYQKKLIDPSLLTAEEISYLNEYHSQCRDKVGNLLKQQGKEDALKWLMEQTLPLS